MNDEMREMLEEVSELKHKVDKIERKLQQKIDMRSGGYGRGGGYQRMGQNEGNWNNQSMGQSGGVFWGQQPMNPMGIGGMPNQSPNDWFDPRFM